MEWFMFCPLVQVWVSEEASIEKSNVSNLMCLGVADGWVVILSCLSDSIIRELMDERVNEPWLENQAHSWAAGPAADWPSPYQVTRRHSGWVAQISIHSSSLLTHPVKSSRESNEINKSKPITWERQHLILLGYRPIKVKNVKSNSFKVRIVFIQGWMFYVSIWWPNVCREKVGQDG